MLWTFLQKVVDKLTNTFRKKVFREKITKCGKNLAIYGKIYLINQNIEVGNNVKIYPGVQFFGGGLIKIGNNVSIGNNTMIYASEDGGIEIGDDTIIAAQCYIIDMNHGMKKGQLIRNQENIAQKVVIENDVWIGANVTVLKGSHIESGTVIGAKSLVNNRIPENSIAIGIPARSIKMREG